MWFVLYFYWIMHSQRDDIVPYGAGTDSYGVW